VATPVITVNQRGAARLRAGQVWVYRSDLVPPADAPAGSLVHVRDERGRRLGSALYSSASQIAIRLISNEEISPEALPDMLRARITGAVKFRQQIAEDSGSYRVIFSEADLLPGLIVDRYNDVLSMQAVTQAFDRDDLRQIVIESLAEHSPGSSLIERVDPHIRELEQLAPRESQLLLGERWTTIFTLNAVRFHFDGMSGQKTGAFDLLKDYATGGRQYDTIVLDPPAFAKTKRAVPTALRGYKELNLRAMKMLRPGGILVTCSCSFHVGEGEFLEMLGSAAADAGRRVRILEKRDAALDHPVLLNVPETSYLKCIICQIPV
jgi:23S rRNA G2069 N7-methylase RlmK/C1962 C5-methylase RlmI